MDTTIAVKMCCTPSIDPMDCSFIPLHHDIFTASPQSCSRHFSIAFC